MKGWKGDSLRHSLAARGIKSVRHHRPARGVVLDRSIESYIEHHKGKRIDNHKQFMKFGINTNKPIKIIKLGGGIKNVQVEIGIDKYLKKNDLTRAQLEKKVIANTKRGLKNGRWSWWAGASILRSIENGTFVPHLFDYIIFLEDNGQHIGGVGGGRTGVFKIKQGKNSAIMKIVELGDFRTAFPGLGDKTYSEISKKLKLPYAKIQYLDSFDAHDMLVTNDVTHDEGSPIILPGLDQTKGVFLMENLKSSIEDVREKFQPTVDDVVNTSALEIVLGVEDRNVDNYRVNANRDLIGIDTEFIGLQASKNSSYLGLIGEENMKRLGSDVDKKVREFKKILKPEDIREAVQPISEYPEAIKDAERLEKKLINRLK